MQFIIDWGYVFSDPSRKKQVATAIAFALASTSWFAHTGHRQIIIPIALVVVSYTADTHGGTVH